MSAIKQTTKKKPEHYERVQKKDQTLSKHGEGSDQETNI